MKQIKHCAECMQTVGIEEHHIIHRSRVKALIKCKHNIVCLCAYHHRNQPNGIHSNSELDKKYRLQFQNWLEINFLKSEYAVEEIADILEISLNNAISLCKMIYPVKGKYTREDIIRQAMGGKVEIEGE